MMLGLAADPTRYLYRIGTAVRAAVSDVNTANQILADLYYSPQPTAPRYLH